MAETQEEIDLRRIHQVANFEFSGYNNALAVSLYLGLNQIAKALKKEEKVETENKGGLG